MSLDPAALRSVADALTDLAAAIRNALDEPEAKPDARQGPETTYRDAHDTFGTRRGVVRADIPESGGQPEHHCDEPAVNLRVEGMSDATAEQIAAAMRRAGVPARIEQAPPPDPRLVAGEDAVPWWPAFAIVGLVVLAALGIAALVTGWRP